MDIFFLPRPIPAHFLWLKKQIFDRLTFKNDDNLNNQTKHIIKNARDKSVIFSVHFDQKFTWLSFTYKIPKKSGKREFSKPNLKQNEGKAQKVGHLDREGETP